MFRSGRLRQRVVIDVRSADRLGYVSDVEIDEITGRISGIVLRGGGGFFSWVFHFKERIIPWESITAFGEEFVLVKSLDLNEKYLKKS